MTENREIKSSVFTDLFGDDELVGKKNFSYEIQYTRAADKFFAIHEDIRNEYEDA